MESSKVIELIKKTSISLSPKRGQADSFWLPRQRHGSENSGWDILILLDKDKRSVKDINEYAFPHP